MIIKERCRPDLPSEVTVAVHTEVSAALTAIVTQENKFIVNDTSWFISRNGKPMPCVMNSAEYLSKRFQKTLRVDFGWRTDVTIEGQEIDGFKSFPVCGVGCVLSHDQLLEVVGDIWKRDLSKDVLRIFTEVYHRYFRRSIFEIGEGLETYRSLFSAKPLDPDTVLKVGVEFETGNIASSFRAFSKLNLLYAIGEIDVGVFVTSDRRDTTAGKIWPMSNRNGSFQELENRRYQETVQFPIWEYSFRPDGYSPDVGYLASNGSLYQPTSTGRSRRLAGRAFRVFKRRASTGADEEVLLPD